MRTFARSATAKGFTLIELLVVIAIIGLLAAIIVTSLGASKQKARDAERLNNLRVIGQMLEEYRIDKGHYPVSADWASDCTHGGNNWIPDGADYGWSDAYISAVPHDPAQNCSASPARTYQYKSNGKTYEVTAVLEGTKPPGVAGNGQNESGVSYDGLLFTTFAIDQGPIIATLSSVQSPTNQSPIPFTISFSRAVVDFSIGSLSVINGFISGLTEISQALYSFFVTPTDNATITAVLDQNAVHDEGGTGNTAAQASVEYDSLRPHVALSPDPLPAQVSGAFTITVNTTVPVTDFSASSVSVSNGTVSNAVFIAPNNGSNYSFVVTPAAPGAVTVVIPDGTLHSAAANSNVTSNELSTTYAP